MLTLERINTATFAELQTLATENGIKASGKGVTADFLRMQLNALISANEEPSTEESEEPLVFNGKQVPKPAKDSEETAQDVSNESEQQDVAAEENGSEEVQNEQQSQESTKEQTEEKDAKKPEKTAQQLRIEKLLKEDPSKLFKVQRLVYVQDAYSWTIELIEKIDAPVSKNTQIAVICKIFDAVYTMANSKYEVIRDKTIIDDYKLRAILGAVVGAKLTDATVNYFRIKGWLVPAKLSTKSCYFITPKLMKIYESISGAFID